MALVVVWMLTALIVLATVCIGVFKDILSDNVAYVRRPRDFVLDRLARYGDPFTTSLIGTTYTVVNSPKAVKFVLSTAHASFESAYPLQYRQLLSQDNFTGTKHAQVRKSILSVASGDGFQKFFRFINSLAEETVKSWENQAVVNSVEESKKFAFIVGMHMNWANIISSSEEIEKLRKNFSLIAEGVVALPINFPGFVFHKAMKAKQVLVSCIQSEISRRRKGGIQQDDLLNALMNIGEDEFPNYNIACTIVTVIIASYITTSALIPWVLKYLENFPKVRQHVQDEQHGLRQKMIEDKSFNWFKPKSSMPYTLQVIYEVLRIEFFLTIPRQVNKDVDYNGVVFHKGSYVWASATSLHLDPKYHPNPYEFDPSRFDEKLQPSPFLAFGQGPHLCPGSELALAETMFLIHHLITNYSWGRCGPEKGVTQHPIRRLEAFPIRLVKR